MAQPRAAQTACRGKKTGSFCYFQLPKPVESLVTAGVAVAGLPPSMTAGHCYLLDTWRDGSGGTQDFDGNLRASMMACLQDGGLAQEELASLAPNTSAPVIEKSEAQVRIQEVVEWVITGGWKIVAAAAGGCCLLLSTSMYLTAKCLRENEIPSTFVGWLPVSLSRSHAEKPYKYSWPWRQARQRQGYRKAVLKGHELQKAKVVADKERGKTTNSKVRPKKKSELSVPPSKLPSKSPKQAFDYDAELRALGLTIDIEDEATLPPRADLRSTSSSLQLPSGAVPRLGQPPKPTTPVDYAALSPETHQTAAGFTDYTPGTSSSATALLMPGLGGRNRFFEDSANAARSERGVRVWEEAVRLNSGSPKAAQTAKPPHSSLPVPRGLPPVPPPVDLPANIFGRGNLLDELDSESDSSSSSSSKSHEDSPEMKPLTIRGRLAKTKARSTPRISPTSSSRFDFTAAVSKWDAMESDMVGLLDADAEQSKPILVPRTAKRLGRRAGSIARSSDRSSSGGSPASHTSGRTVASFRSARSGPSVQSGKSVADKRGRGRGRSLRV